MKRRYKSWIQGYPPKRHHAKLDNAKEQSLRTWWRDYQQCTVYLAAVEPTRSDFLLYRRPNTTSWDCKHLKSFPESVLRGLDEDSVL